jgi:hypothetical protein
MRASFAEYPAAGERPAPRHDGLMVSHAAGDTTEADCCYTATRDGGQGGRFEVAASGAPEISRTGLARTSRRVLGP